jgi:predicted anti-sigma-YlaC factor YlaD
MRDHEGLRQQIALAAAGALQNDEILEVQQHLKECEGCRREYDAWASYGRGLRQLPQPQFPADLIARTQARVLREYVAAENQKSTVFMLLALSAFSWLITFSTWALTRMLTGGVVEVFGVNVVNAGPWFVTSFVATSITAGVSALMLSSHREGRRVI